jgi:hypothetical protein
MLEFSIFIVLLSLTHTILAGQRRQREVRLARCMGRAAGAYPPEKEEKQEQVIGVCFVPTGTQTHSTLWLGMVPGL